MDNSIYNIAVKNMESNEISNYESDLYLKVTQVSEKLIAEYEFKESVRKFFSKVDKSYWFDIPFAFDPFWNKK